MNKKYAQKDITRDPAVLRASLIQKSERSLPALVGLLAIFIIVYFSLRHLVPPFYLMLWMIPVAIAFSVRIAITHYILKKITTLDNKKVRFFNNLLTFNSASIQLFVGSGIWWVSRSDAGIAPQIVTFILTLYSVGNMINMMSDFRALILSNIILLGQPIIFWFTIGANWYWVSIALFTILVLMSLAGQKNSRIFAENILVSKEKDRLIKKIAAEKNKAEKALKKAQNANKAKAFFMAAASHDLRQPLYAISILNETLGLQELDDNLSSIVNKQAEAIETLSGLFNNLLDLSRFEAGQVRKNIKVFDLVPLVQKLQSEFSLISSKKKLKLTVIAPNEAIVKTDPELLSRMLRNLIGNAISYTEQGSINITINRKQHNTQIIIQDTGIGISPEDQKRIFQEYYQIDNPHRNRQKGVGLGLAIVKNINQILNTKLKLSSAPVEGSCFKLKLKNNNQPVETSTDKNEQTINYKMLAGFHLWLMEDDPIVRDALTSQLKNWQINYRFFDNDQQLVEHYHKQQQWPDIFIFDDMLGLELNGMEIANKLVAMGAKPECFLIVTGNADIKRISELEKSQFKIMQKPVSLKQIMQWAISIAK